MKRLRKKAQPVFKEYTQGQMLLLPVNIDALIPPNHLVRVVNDFVDQMDIQPILGQYKGGGTSGYHPRMMLKVLIFAYTQKIFSSRRIAKAVRENLYFIWLSGHNQPDFRTINRFRGVILKGIIEEVFLAVLVLLIQEGYVKLENYFLDGTKLEANANRYTFVWSKNTERYSQQLREKVEALFEKIEQINQEENARYADRDLEELGEDGPIDPHKLAQQVSELNQSLKEKPGEPSPKDEGEDRGGGPAPQGPSEAAPAEQAPTEPAKAEVEESAPTAQESTQSQPEEPCLSQRMESKLQELKQILAEKPGQPELSKAVKLLTAYLPRAEKYERQQRILAGRNSYSKTDTDAIFMRMKEDHMRNGQLKPGYNVQIGTESQFVVGFSLHQAASDTRCLIPHLEQVKGQLKRLPRKMIADAAYGSEENYIYLDQEQVQAFVKYNTFHKEQKKRYRPNPFQVENLPYEPEQDRFTCPHGKHLTYQKTINKKTKGGFPTERRVYECENCEGCPLKKDCHRRDGNRTMEVGFRLWKYRQQAKDNLLSEEGQRLRIQRNIDVETVFGRIKEDWGFRRFMLRGLDKVTTEWGILCIAHNLAKVFTHQNRSSHAIS